MELETLRSESPLPTMIGIGVGMAISELAVSRGLNSSRLNMITHRYVIGKHKL